MSLENIRQSLHYGTYLEHAICLKLAADENTLLFLKIAPLPLTDDNRKKGLGLLNSSLLLYSISLELLLKARALFAERYNIQDHQIKNYADFMQKWKGKSDGHTYKEIIDHYKIDLSKEEKEILDNLQPYTSWAGRFPFPLREHLIKEYEASGEGPGTLSQAYIEQIGNLFRRQIGQMTDK